VTSLTAHEDLVSILMPTFNDSKYLAEAIESVLSQTYRKLQLIIVDDGSTDNTPEIVKDFGDERILYLRQENRGQLEAINNGAKSAEGRYITLLHSDDTFSDNRAIERCVQSLKHENIDGVFCDLLTMNAEGTNLGMSATTDEMSDSSPALLFLRGGSNITSDIFFIKREALDSVLSAYVLWNMPYWLRFEDSAVGTLRLKKAEPWYRYRVYGENYLRSDIGRFETVNGCLRTVTQIGQRIDVPLLKLQRLAARTLGRRFKPLFNAKPCAPHRLREMVRHVVSRYYEKTPENRYLKNLLAFYSSFPSHRTVRFDPTRHAGFLGKDARAFFNMVNQGKLPQDYEKLLEESATGFGRIIVGDESAREKAESMVKFLNLAVKVEIQ